MLTDLKKDLDNVLKRIKVVKQRVAQQNPEAFNGKISEYINEFSLQTETKSKPLKSEIRLP